MLNLFLLLIEPSVNGVTSSENAIVESQTINAEVTETKEDGTEQAAESKDTHL